MFGIVFFFFFAVRLSRAAALLALAPRHLPVIVYSFTVNFLVPGIDERTSSFSRLPHCRWYSGPKSRGG